MPEVRVGQKMPTSVTIAIVIVIAVLGILAFLYFLGSARGLELIHRQNISAILRVIEAQRLTNPNRPLREIYLSIAQERNERLKWLKRGHYLSLLSGAGCFDESTSMSPEEFARTAADVQYGIKISLAEGPRTHP